MSWDTMAQLGTPPLRAGDVLQVGDAAADWPATDLAPVAAMDTGLLELPLLLGPRDDWFTDEALDRLASHEFTVTSRRRSCRHPARRSGATAAAATANSPARVSYWAPCRCRPGAGPRCSWLTDRSPAGIPSSAWCRGPAWIGPRRHCQGRASGSSPAAREEPVHSMTNGRHLLSTGDIGTRPVYGIAWAASQASYSREDDMPATFGLAVENFTSAEKTPQIEELLVTARRAEELGFTSLWAWDHLFLGSRQPFPQLEALTTLAVLAIPHHDHRARDRHPGPADPRPGAAGQDRGHDPGDLSRAGYGSGSPPGGMSASSTRPAHRSRAVGGSSSATSRSAWTCGLKEEVTGTWDDLSFRRVKMLAASATAAPGPHRRVRRPGAQAGRHARRRLVDLLLHARGVHPVLGQDSAVRGGGGS